MEKKKMPFLPDFYNHSNLCKTRALTLTEALLSIWRIQI